MSFLSQMPKQPPPPNRSDSERQRLPLRSRKPPPGPYSRSSPNVAQGQHRLLTTHASFRPSDVNAPLIQQQRDIKAAAAAEYKGAIEHYSKLHQESFSVALPGLMDVRRGRTAGMTRA